MIPLFFFLSQRLGITFFFMLPWLLVLPCLPVERNWYSVVTEAWIPAGPGGLQTRSNSCPRRGTGCSRICLPGSCLCRSSPPTTSNVSFHPRTASTFVTLWRGGAVAMGWFTQRDGGFDCAALEWAAWCCSECHVSKSLYTWTKPFRLVPQNVSRRRSHASQAWDRLFPPSLVFISNGALLQYSCSAFPSQTSVSTEENKYSFLANECFSSVLDGLTFMVSRGWILLILAFSSSTSMRLRFMVLSEIS